MIGVQRYILICHPSSSRFSPGKVRGALKGAWVLVCGVCCLSAYPNDLVRVDLNSTHYTLLCRNDFNLPLTRVILIVVAILVYLLPTVILIFTWYSVSIMRTTWKRNPPNAVHPQQNSSGMAIWSAKRNKAPKRLVGLIIIAFMFPYALMIGYAAYNTAFTPSINFRRDYVIRNFGSLLAYINGSVNFVIHLVQLNGFGQTMKSYVVCFEQRSKGRRCEPLP